MNKIKPFNIKPYKGLITFFDLETAPNIGDFWKAGYDINVSSENIILERQIISAQWRTVGEKQVQVRTWTMPTAKELKQMKKFINSIKSIPAYNKDAAFHLLASCAHSDKHVIDEVVDILLTSQLVIGQNSNAFDIPWLKGRVLYHRSRPLKNIVTLDTLKISRKNFGLNSHSLDYKSRYLFSDGKIPTRYSMWQKVMQGDVKTLDQLCNKYGKKDVLLLEKVFCEMVPYCEKLPVQLSSLLNNKNIKCPDCGNTDLSSNGWRVKAKRRYQRYVCYKCNNDFLGEIIKADE